MDVAFVTKLLHFAGYESPNLPRPLIYDKRVADAITRLTTAPLLPAAGDKVTTVAYDQYCRWVQDAATERGTEPAQSLNAARRFRVTLRVRGVC